MNPALLLLIPFASAGLALIHQGLGRSRSAAHTMLATLCALAVAAIAFTLVGFSLAGPGPAHAVTLAAHPFSLFSARPLFARASLFDLEPAHVQPLFVLAFGLFAAGIAAIIPISAGSDRWRLGPTCAVTAVLAALTFPLLAHWIWLGGWLQTLSLNFALPAFLDSGGAAVIHTLGGLTALSVVWILGPRRGKYSPDGIASAIPGHNIVLIFLGCLLALPGFIGLNASAHQLFEHSALPAALPSDLPPDLTADLTASLRLALIAINSTLAASAGALAVVLTTRIRYRKPDASLTANGWIAGLVASSACSAFCPFAASIVIGFVAGLLVAGLIETLELRLLIDDPGGAISVHAGAGLWGLLAAAFVAPGPILPQLAAQLLGIATLLGAIFPLLHALNLLLNRLSRFRVDSDGDWQGMDIRELGAGAYPEFVIHADEFVPR